MVSQCQQFLQVQSQKASSAMMKLALMRTATGRPRVTSAAEDTFIRFTSLRNCSPTKCFSSSNRHISISTVQRRLRESGLHGRIAAKKPLLKDANKKKRLVRAKKHDRWTLDRWKSVFWSDESKCEIFGSNRHVFVVDEQMNSICVIPTVKHGRGSMGALCW